MMLERSCVTVDSIDDKGDTLNVVRAIVRGGSRGVVVATYLIDLVLVDNETRELVCQVVLSRAEDIIPTR